MRRRFVATTEPAARSRSRISLSGAGVWSPRGGRKRGRATVERESPGDPTAAPDRRGSGPVGESDQSERGVPQSSARLETNAAVCAIRAPAVPAWHRRVRGPSGRPVRGPRTRPPAREELPDCGRRERLRLGRPQLQEVAALRHPGCRRGTRSRRLAVRTVCRPDARERGGTQILTLARMTRSVWGVVV